MKGYSCTKLYILFSLFSYSLCQTSGATTLSNVVVEASDGQPQVPLATHTQPGGAASTNPTAQATSSPTCIQSRGPNDPSASDISQALTSDNSVSKGCDVTYQQTSIIGTETVVSYGLDDAYFFNASHPSYEVNQPMVPANFCPDTFNQILSLCVTGSQNFWGGWIVAQGTNYSGK